MNLLHQIRFNKHHTILLKNLLDVELLFLIKMAIIRKKTTNRIF